MTPAASEQRLTLRVGADQLSVPFRVVREVARMPRLTRVPHAPEAMLGVANVRGDVIPVLSVARLTEREGRDERRLVVIDAGARFALAVDDIAELRGTGATENSVDVLALATRSLGSAKVADRGAASAAGVAAAEAARDDAADTVSLFVFLVGGQSFALPLDAVEDVLRMPAEVARLPHGDAQVLGSIESRGALLPLLSLATLLALPGLAISARSRVLVTRIGDQRVGLVVDAVDAVLRVAARDIDPVPLVLTRGDAEARIQAICRVGAGRLVSVLAPGHLLRDDLTARLMQGTGSERAMPVAANEGEVHEQFVLFQVGGDDFALPVAAVEEIGLLPATLAPLPNGPGFVRGLMNLRGSAVPVIDQASRFGGRAAGGNRQRLIVVTLGRLRAAFLVDAVAGVRRIATSALRPAPELGSTGTRIFERVVADDARVVLVLSPRELLDGTERDILDAALAAGEAT